MDPQKRLKPSTPREILDARGRRGMTIIELPSMPRTRQDSEDAGRVQVPDENAELSATSRGRRKTGGDKRGPENENVGLPKTPRRLRETSEASMTAPKRKTARQGKAIPYEQTPLEQSEQQTTADEPKLDFPPATFTGFTELPIWRAFLILLLWLPRLFIPWIAAWHEFNVFVLSNPWHWKDREGELLQNKIRVLVGKSIIAILSSALVDRIRKKFELEYYVYFFLSALFSLSPVVGGLVDVLLRDQFYDGQIYKDRWFTSVVLMQWAMSAAFMMFPTQFACIYSQNSIMSRNAHYNWTSLFMLIEFINAYVAFLIIPGPCPTKDWTQIVVWAGILLLMITVVILTLIFLFAVRVLQYAMLMCFKKPAVAEPDSDPFVDRPSDLKIKKLMWFSMISLPVIMSYFIFAVLERFIPYEEWDDHHFLSALGVFLFWKIIGIILTVLVMFIVRKAYRKRKPLSLKIEMIYLGLPHVLCILALATLAGRFSTLSHLKEGDIIVGPIPDKDKAVLIFVNSVFRNRTVCISSEYFRPVKVRPRHLVARELYDIGVENITVFLEVDPCSEPIYKYVLHVKNLKKGEWKIYDVALLSMNHTKKYVWDYYRDVYPSELLGVGNLRPEVGAPQMMIYQRCSFIPIDAYYYEFNHSTLGSFSVGIKLPGLNSYLYDRHLVSWKVPATGTWSVRLWCNFFNQTDAFYAWVINCSQCVSPLQFEVENNSLYLLVEHSYEEDTPFEFHISPRDFYHPPDYQFPMYPYGYTCYKIGEVAGPNSDRLPSNKELQKDWAVKVCMALAGMAAGGIFLGFVYLFWVDVPIPRYRTLTLAVCWVLMGVAAEIPRINSIAVGVNVSFALLTLQVVMAGLHFTGAYFMYAPVFNFRIRPD